MSLPIWDDIVDSEENYIRTKIPQELWVTESGASIFENLKELGFAIGENRFYSIRRDVLNIVKHSEQIASLNPETPIPLGYMDKVPTWNMSRDYMYQVKYTYTVGDDPTEREGYFTYMSNERLSKGTVEADSISDLTTLQYKKDDKVIRITGSELQHVYTTRETA